MKPNRILITIVLLLLLGILAAALMFLPRKSAPPTEVPFTPTEPQFLEGTFPPSQEPIGISLQGAKEGKSVALSWDESKLQIFHVVLLDTKWQAVWLLSSLGTLPAASEQNINIKREDVSLFMPSGYVAGDTIEGFQSLGDQGVFELTLGKKYYLQVMGFTKDDESIAVNKEFTFTALCLPPDCQ